MNIKEPFKLMPAFWIGATLASWGYYVSLTASLLNLYRIRPTASPILTMMILEAIIPLVFLKLLARMFQIFTPRSLYISACLLGVLGAGLQTLHTSNLTSQFCGIALIAAAMAIQRPLMMQVATFVTESKDLREKINNLLNGVNYVGMLAGYISSGLVITYGGYRHCFLLNAATFVGLGISVIASKFPAKTTSDEPTNNFSLSESIGVIRKVPHLRTLFLLSFAIWLTGGSINVLEVPFLKKTMAATDMIVSLLFFATALGAITYSLTNERSFIPPLFKHLPSVTAAAGALILIYVVSARLSVAIPALLAFGYVASSYNVISMNALQSLAPRQHLGAATLALNTTVQTTTLMSAAFGVFLSQFSTERSVCVLFSVATILISAYSRVKLKTIVQ